MPSLFTFIRLLLFVVGGSATAAASAAPVTPNASPEARALLQLLYDISGRYTLTGQHNYPNTKDRNTQFAARYIGKTPVVFTTDWGHAKAGDSDSYLARPDIVQECIRQHHLGAIVSICWHAVPPTADEPVTFRPLPGADPTRLKSVQGQLLDEQFRDVLTPGTALYQKWCDQVDTIAAYLKQLQDAHVPVLWRPYHEMNGDWFWWGGRAGPNGTVALYRQLFDRYVNHHHLTNLLWLWSMDRVSKPEMEHAKFFPGIAYVDVLGLDVYRNDFAQSYYDSLVKLSEGKPLALAEVGNPPAPEILEKQPRWTYYAIWAGMVRNTSPKTYDALVHDPRFLGLEDPAYADAAAAYRRACGLPPLHFTARPPNFSGIWILNLERSTFGRTGAGIAPAKLEIIHNGETLTIRSTRVLEFADDEVTEENVALDGSPSKSEFMNSPRVTTARFSEDGKTIVMRSSVTPASSASRPFTTTDTWSLQSSGERLAIQRTADSPMGAASSTLVFDKR